MNVAIYCGSSFGNDKIYEESTKLLAQKLANKDFKIVYGGSLQGLMGIISNESLRLNNSVTGVITHDLVSKEIENKNITKIYKVDTMNQRKEKMAELVAAIEMRAEQIFDRIQLDPKSSKGDMYLIQYFNLLISACEKLDKINNSSLAATSVTNNNTIYNVQYIDEQASIIYDAIRETLSEIDLDASFLFMEKVNDKLSKLKLKQKDEFSYIPVDIRDSEIKLLDSKIKNNT